MCVVGIFLKGSAEFVEIFWKVSDLLPFSCLYASRVCPSREEQWKNITASKSYF